MISNALVRQQNGAHRRSKILLLQFDRFTKYSIPKRKLVFESHSNKENHWENLQSIESLPTNFYAPSFYQAFVIIFRFTIVFLFLFFFFKRLLSYFFIITGVAFHKCFIHPNHWRHQFVSNKQMTIQREKEWERENQRVYCFGKMCRLSLLNWMKILGLQNN